MLDDNQATCPQCGSAELRPGSVVIATLPPSAVRPGRVRKAVEQKYRCLNCNHEFSTVEESLIDD
jgi:DNA-directed RNA polymerase subunit RPC12/RpoP